MWSVKVQKVSCARDSRATTTDERASSRSSPTRRKQAACPPRSPVAVEKQKRPGKKLMKGPPRTVVEGKYLFLSKDVFLPDGSVSTRTWGGKGGSTCSESTICSTSSVLGTGCMHIQNNPRQELALGMVFSSPPVSIWRAVWKGATNSQHHHGSPSPPLVPPRLWLAFG